MINYVSESLSNVNEWCCELQESENWIYYVHDRAVCHGFPVAVITSGVAAALFNCAKISTGATFGAVNYLALTFLLEAIRARHHIDTAKAVAILAIGSAVSVGFVQTICNTPVSWPAVLALSIAAFAGQLFREYYMTESS